MNISRVPANRRNRLLAALQPSDYSLLAPHLKVTRLKQGTVLQESGDPIRQVYFPESGMVSVLAVMQAGNGIEIATIGREGAVGYMAALGSRHAAGRAVVQVDADASQISASNFRSAFDQSPGIRDLILRYNDVQMALVQQSAGCNALHHVEKRLCRWLLQTRDRCDSDILPLTHELLSEMLGVQRTTVTVVARALQTQGLVRYRRGQVEIIDRHGLEKKACECYEVVRGKSEEVFSHDDH
ncbi:MAG: Crp/Fnr family transcriptional regulator [Beijerinckiaceae bacterium]|nr:Crp/Fnr family transcriptional regulator [Beijerinckiaceae bacterium]